MAEEEDGYVRVTVEDTPTTPKKAEVRFQSETSKPQIQGTGSSGVTGNRDSSNSLKARSQQVKKHLREAFLQDAVPQETEDEIKERPEKLKVAKDFMMQTACTDDQCQWKPLKTPVKELGQYGVGVQLYFQFLIDLGLLFMFLFLFTIPMMYFSLGGSMLEDFPETKEQNFFYKLMAAFTPANLGTCGADAADCLRQQDRHDRKVFGGSEGLLRDVTPALGILDFLQSLIALVFIVFFRVYKIPKAVRIQDEANITASDYAVRVSGLPRKLDEKDHPQYEDLLQQHFENILATECGISEPGKVAEVTLIREYDGCISLFLQQGNLLEEMHEAGVASRLAKKAGKDKDAEKHEKKRQKLKQKIDSIEDSLAHQSDLQDVQREVCGAFVMFEEERLKDAICNVYKPFRGWASRLFEPHYLHFKDWRLTVTETCEPEELYWENMDYSWFLHKMRKLATLTVSFLIVVFCIFIMTFLRSGETAVDTSAQGHDLWIFEIADRPRDVQGGQSGPGQCMELCQLDLMFDLKCKDTWSPSMYLESLKDDQGTFWNATSNTGLHLLVDSVTECTTANTWRAPSCTAPPGTNVTSHLYYELNQKAAVKCVKVAKGETGGDGGGGGGGGGGGPPGRRLQQAPAPMRVYGCDAQYASVENSSGLFDANGQPFSISTHCLRYDDIVMESYSRTPAIRLRQDCLFPVTKEAAQVALAEGEDKILGPRLRCYCTQQIANDPFLRIPGYYNKAENVAAEICEDFIWYQGTQLGVRMGGVVAVMVINNILLVLFAYFDSLGRYQTATDLAASQVFNLFLATLVNTAIVYNLIGINFYTSNDSVFGALKFGQGPHDDLNPNWFITIGNMLVITIVCQIACSVALPVLWVWTVDPLLRWFFCKDTHSQELLNEYHVLPEWTLSLRVAETLVVVFCVLMYSTGFPVLYLFGALYCLLAFWADKYALLRGSRKPPGYTKSAIESAVIMCPFAILFHLLFAIWLFGNQDIMPSNWGGSQNFAAGLFSVTLDEYNRIMEIVAQSGFDVRGKQYWEYLKARMSDAGRTAAEPSFILLIIMLIYYAIVILKALFAPCLGNRLNLLADSALKATGIIREAAQETVTLSDAKAKGETKGLLTYRMAENPNYEEAVLALRFDPDGGDKEAKEKRKSDKGVSFSAIEENLERTVAQKYHEAE
ncbi:unnamed protein product, partial [Symbiodinium natans]